MMNLDSVLAERQLATETISDPETLRRLTLLATGDAELAEERMVSMMDARLRAGLSAE